MDTYKEALILVENRKTLRKTRMARLLFGQAWKWILGVRTPLLGRQQSTGITISFYSKPSGISPGENMDKWADYESCLL
jgi:hypothetical protein